MRPFLFAQDQFALYPNCYHFAGTGKMLKNKEGPRGSLAQAQQAHHPATYMATAPCGQDAVVDLYDSPP
jgi:hypothetical protein